MYVVQIIADSAAEKNNIEQGDFILNYAGTDLMDGYNNLEEVISQVENIEKILAFARKEPNGSFRIFTQTFPAGEMGIKMVETAVDVNEYTKLLEAYKKFQK